VRAESYDSKVGRRAVVDVLGSGAGPMKML
jgi:hypothetical protein